MTIELTEEEVKTLGLVMIDAFTVCTCGCITEEIQKNADINCDNCPFASAVRSIRKKVDNLFAHFKESEE